MSGAPWELTLHLVVEGELLSGSDGSGGKQSDPGEPLVDVVDEHVEHLQVGVTLQEKSHSWRLFNGETGHPQDDCISKTCLTGNSSASHLARTSVQCSAVQIPALVLRCGAM